MTDEPIYWVGFNLVKGIGAVRLQALLDHFGDLSLAWRASSHELEAAGLSPRIVQNLVQMRQQIDLEHILADIQRQKIQVLTWMDEESPPD